MLSFSVQNVLAQLPAHYVASPWSVPDKTDSLRLVNQYNLEIAELPADLPAHVRKSICETYKEKYKAYLDSRREGYFLDSSFIYFYVNGIMQRLLKSNPDLPQDMRCYITTSAEVNAFASGNHCIQVNIGFLVRTKNEAEIAFALAHELSHEKHNDLQAENIIIATADENKKHEIKKVLREEYGIKEKLAALVLPELFSQRAYSRQNESKADSAGLFFMTRAGYHPRASVTTINLLDSVSAPRMNDTLNLRRFFSFADIPLQGKYFEGYSGSSLGAFTSDKDSAIELLQDSLRTHPECEARRNNLDKLISTQHFTGGNYFISSPDSFARMKYEAQMEEIELQYDYVNIDAAIFLCLLHLPEKPGDIYIRAMLSHCFSLCAIKKKERKLGLYVRNPSPFYSDNINKLLTFLIELSTDDCAALAYAMIHPVDESLKKYDLYLAALTQAAYVNKKNDEFHSTFREYYKTFPHSRYNEYILPYIEKTELTKK